MNSANRFTRALPGGGDGRLAPSSRASATSRTMTRAWSSLSLPRDRYAGPVGPEEVMNWHRWLAALIVMLALAACAQGVQVPYAPENMHDRGGDGGMM
jgi:hypothetical protein